VQLPNKQVHTSWSKVGLLSVRTSRTIHRGIQLLFNHILNPFQQFSSKLLRWLITYSVTDNLYGHCINNIVLIYL